MPAFYRSESRVPGPPQGRPADRATITAQTVRRIKASAGSTDGSQAMKPDAHSPIRELNLAALADDFHRAEPLFSAGPDGPMPSS